MKSLLKNKRALSPVIATVILVAVTIVVAVSVAYWMGTISTSYTAHEQIEMPTSYASYVDDLFDIQIPGEAVGSGDGTNVAPTLSPLNTPVVPGTVSVTDGVEKFTDDGAGVLTGDKGGSGSIDYLTGELSVTFNTAPGDGVAITADYTQEVGNGWKIHIGLKNTGSADSTIDNIFLNDKPIKDYLAGGIKLFETDESGEDIEIPDLSEISVHVAKGSDEDLTIWIQQDVEGCNSGVTINLKIHSAQGNLYPVSVKLP